MSASADRAFWMGRSRYAGKPGGMFDGRPLDLEDCELVYDDAPVRLVAPPARLSAASATVLVSAGFLLGALAAGGVAWAVASGCIASAAATPVTFISEPLTGAAR